MTAAEDLLKKWAWWARNRASRPLAHTTIKAYGSCLRALADWAADASLELSALSRSDLESFLASRSQKANSTQANFFTAVQSFHEYLVVAGEREDNPAEQLTFRREQRPPKPQRRSQSLGSQLAQLGPRDRGIADFVMELRDKDVSLMEIFSIEVDPPSVIPEQVLVQNGRGEHRSVSLSPNARQCLRRWGGRIPIGIRAFQRSLEKVGLSPKLLEESTRSVVSVELHPRLQKPVFEQIENGEFTDATARTFVVLRNRLRELHGQPEDAPVEPLLVRNELEPAPVERGAGQSLRLLAIAALQLFGQPGWRDEVVKTNPAIARESVLLGDLLLRLFDKGFADADI